MREALRLARRAAKEGEVPVGAVLVVEGKIVGRGRNRREARQDPLAHAEIEALRQASKRLGTWRVGGTMYSTLEPCPMCAGALLQARVERLVYAARDPKAGAVRSVVRLLRGGRFNHTVAVTAGVLEQEASVLLASFFKSLR
jgi:tRNA(adenine34) deaminase